MKKKRQGGMLADPNSVVMEREMEGMVRKLPFDPSSVVRPEEYIQNMPFDPSSVVRPEEYIQNMPYRHDPSQQIDPGAFTMLADPNSVVREGEFTMLADPNSVVREGEEQQNWKTGMLSEITSEYPGLAKHDWRLMEGDPKTNVGGGYLEFRHPQDQENQFPGHPTIEVYPSTTQLPREELKKMVYGDMLHYMPEADPEFSGLRDQYAQSLTDEQKRIDRMAYQGDVRRSLMQDRRPRGFDRFMDISRLDAHLRGYLAPDRNNEWAGSYTPEQINTFKSIQELLRQPR